jgi:hypothetical protein
MNIPQDQATNTQLCSNNADLLKKPEVKTMLRLKSLRTVERYMADGIIPYIKLGTGRRATVLFRRSDILDHINQNFRVPGRRGN